MRLVAVALLLAGCGGSGSEKLVPTAPYDVLVSVDAGAIGLSWTAPDKGGDIQRYAVMQSTDGATFVPAAATFPTATSARVAGLPAGVQYWFTVIARNANGDSPPSDAAGPVTP